MIKSILHESTIRPIAVIYTILAIAVINGLLSSAVMLTEDRGDVLIAKRVFDLALILRGLGLGVLFVLVGIGPIKEAALRVLLCGYASGMFTAIVSGYCLFYYTVITHNQGAILSHDFFPFLRILFAGVVTGIGLLCLKIICCLLNRIGKQ